MNIILNNMPTPLPRDYMTIQDLVEWKGVRQNGTAIAVNGKIIRKESWPIVRLSNLDFVTIISAAFGG